MKLIVKKPELEQGKQLQIHEKNIPCYDDDWHYHQEYELIYVVKGSGIRFVGDSAQSFQEGDLVLVGPNVPHLWKDKNGGEVNKVVIKFTDQLVGTDTFKRLEFRHIAQLLEQSKYGIRFENIPGVWHNMVLQLLQMSMPEQLIHFLSLLNKLANSEDKIFLSVTDMCKEQEFNTERLEKVIRFVAAHYNDNISLQQVADIACMSPNYFCRFFKKMTSKSFFQYLNEVRVKNASRLLIQDNLLISEISEIVGYRSITHFNKQFKQIMGTTPNTYRYQIA
ncbi:AraC family transcriptional regulator [Persicobacter diffluens]|uniref:AraC family transcriptional regulator n=1 Tax=Persicobacter diffluens TaxID=981 RepID=A0AAN5AMX8_9BACT|nr:AraC family transcriptional regulator [Persicobacter diffluens]